MACGVVWCFNKGPGIMMVYAMSTRRLCMGFNSLEDGLIGIPTRVLAFRPIPLLTLADDDYDDE